jgi:predicted NUDIX family NTP pyrophosphohydrolase
MYRKTGKELEVFLVHPGGPFFANKDRGVWSIPKGEVGAGEQLQNVAKREFKEETGVETGKELQGLGSIKQAGGKIVHAWAFEGNWKGGRIQSNTFEMEWPPGSGQIGVFPEVNRGEWFSLAAARIKINAAQAFFLDKLALLLE